MLDNFIYTMLIQFTTIDVFYLVQKEILKWNSKMPMAPSHGGFGK